MSAVAAFIEARRDRALLAWSALLFVFWLGCTGPLRWMAGGQLPAWLLGSAPNFFAGLTLTFWQAFAVPARPLASGAVAFLVLAGVEIVQLFLPWHRADAWDVAASAMGCLLGIAALHGRRSGKPPVGLED